jgi:hypothetical protein
MGLILDLIQAGSKLHGPVWTANFTIHLSWTYSVDSWAMAGSRAQDWIRVELEVHGTTPFTHIELVVRVGLHQLKLSGVDLMAYGREEQSVHRVADVLREWWFYEWNVDGDDPTRATMQRLTSFAYRPSPKDWHFSLRKLRIIRVVSFGTCESSGKSNAWSVE